ncbi:MAG: hypothetical protein FWC27_09825 [Firmicutes bacterium]|nr:hypothetical protein [Bacillota bacterium]
MSKTKTKKRIGAGLAILLALAIVLGGTWAWFDFSQNYTNTMRARSNELYDPTLIDEFIDGARVWDDWRLGESLDKFVYVAYDHADEPGYKPNADHDAPNNCGLYLPTWVRVNLTERMTVTGNVTNTSVTAGPTIYTGTEFSQVEWTLGSDVTTLAEWQAYVSAGNSPNGAFWVLDTDGWFYWAQPLAHGDDGTHRTAMLLEAVKLVSQGDLEDIDYYIDVHMEAIDKNLKDFDKWNLPASDAAETDGSCNPGVSQEIMPLFAAANDNKTFETMPDMGVSPQSSTVFVDKDGRIYAGGYNARGNLSDGTDTDRSLPVPMMWDADTPMALDNVKDMKFSLYVKYIQKPDGSWWAVGEGGYGQLSNGTTTNAFYPVPMEWSAGVPMDDGNVKDIRAGTNNLCILDDGGNWWAVGQNSGGQLSNGTTGIGVSYPVQMEWGAGEPMTKANVREMVIGPYSTYLLRSDGKWYGVGQNICGQLCDGSINSQSYPVEMKWDEHTAITSADSVIATGYWSVYLLKSDDTYWAAGQNNYGQLSDGTVTVRRYPVEMRFDADTPMTSLNVQKMLIGSHTGYALGSDNIWYAFGENRYGQFSTGATQPTPYPAGRYPERMKWDANTDMTSANVAELRAQYTVAQIRKPDGSWWAVGYNYYRQLINGTAGNASYPVQMLWGSDDPIVQR